ncbi:MAG TPA: hypothetical protein DCR24_03840 [Bacillus bacterium]|nr:hypothetical protein [Bacillus sp. (in: firmicutes)]
MYNQRRPFYGGGFGGRYFWGGPFVGGLLGGLVGSALLYPRPRPYYPYPYGYGYYPPYGGYPFYY